MEFNEDTHINIRELIFSLSKDELQELERSYERYHYNMLCPLSDEIQFTKRNLQPYSIFSVFYIEMFPDIEKEVITEDRRKWAIDILNITDLDFVDDFLRNPYSTIMQISETFSITESQFSILKKQNAFSNIEICIPLIHYNKEIVENAMNSFGYFLHKELEEKKFVSENNISWITLEFEPNYQPIIAEYLQKHQQNI